MKRVKISVEGQTEETFVKWLLVPHLENYQVFPEPILVSRPGGGLPSYAKAKKEILLHLNDPAVAAVTTMYDLYGLPQDFPGVRTGAHVDPARYVVRLETKMEQDIGDPRFKAYLQLHEFEALLFTKPEQIAAQFPGANALKQLKQIRKAVNSPEEIDNNPQTAPSRRLINLLPRYQKPLHGPLIAINTGLVPIRQACPHFNTWLTWLENL